MKALVNTKSNYRNLNGKLVAIKEFLGSIVACEIYCEELGKMITFDLSLNEIKEIKSN
jgi:hypothetical protein